MERKAKHGFNPRTVIEEITVRVRFSRSAVASSAAEAGTIAGALTGLGGPVDIETYRDISDRQDELEDLRMLEEIRERPLKFRKLEEYLREREQGV